MPGTWCAAICSVGGATSTVNSREFMTTVVITLNVMTLSNTTKVGIRVGLRNIVVVMYASNYVFVS